MYGLNITGATLTPEARKDVLQTAMGAQGIHYWGRVHQHRGGTRYAAVLIEDVTGAAETDASPTSNWAKRAKDGKLWVDEGDIEDAVSLILRDPSGCQCRGVAMRLLTGDLDGPLADVIMQVACFGKVIYG